MVWGQVTRGQTVQEDDWSTTTIRTRNPLKVSLTAEEKGTDWRGGGHRRGQRMEGSGQDEEKCCFKGVEGEVGRAAIYTA